MYSEYPGKSLDYAPKLMHYSQLIPNKSKWKCKIGSLFKNLTLILFLPLRVIALKQNQLHMHTFTQIAVATCLLAAT